MARRVIWTKAAWTDLEAAADYIAKDSTYYAAAFVHEVRDAARTLAHLAQRGRIVPEFRHTRIRELFVRDYRLIYQVSQRVVHVLAFIHGARNLPALWDRGKPGGTKGDD